MDPLEKALLQDIPLGEASSFFLKLKHAGVSPSVKQAAEMARTMRKEKNSQGLGGGANLPPTAMGQNMSPAPSASLPPTAMGQNKVGAAKGPSRAQERAHEQLESKYEKHHHTKGERAFGDLGGLLGAAAGGVAGHKFGKSPHATAAGLLAGYASGKSTGKAVGTSLDAHRFKKKHAMFKTALEAQGLAPASGGGETEDGEVPIDQYLAAEQEGRAAEEAGQAEFLRSKLQEAQAQLQGLQQQSESSQQQMMQMQQQQQMHEQQVQSMQQQSQLATEAAMQNVQQAHDLAMKATSQALQSKDDALNTHQMAAQMRMAYQDMRGHIMDTVAQDNAAPIGEAIKAKGMESQVMPPGGEMGGEMGAEGAPPEQGPADQAASPEGPPGQPVPGEAGAESGGQQPSPEQMGPPEPAGQQGIKQAGAWGDAAGKAGKVLLKRAPHIAGGAILGAGFTGADAAFGTQSLRENVGRLQQEHEQTGSFGTALMLAQNKMRLAMREFTEEHPVGGMALGGALGGVQGGVFGPALVSKVKEAPELIRKLRGQG